MSMTRPVVIGAGSGRRSRGTLRRRFLRSCGGGREPLPGGTCVMLAACRRSCWSMAPTSPRTSSRPQVLAGAWARANFDWPTPIANKNLR